MGRHAKTPCLLAIVLALFASVSAASAAAKALVNSIGANSIGVTGGTFNNPRGLAVNRTGAGGVAAGTLYVVDSANNRIQQFGPTAAFVRAWGWGVRDGGAEAQVCTVAAGCMAGLPGAGAGQLTTPQGIAVDQSNGTLYVTDQGNRRVDVFSPTGAFEGAFGWGAASGADAFEFCAYPSPCSAPNTIGAAAGQAGKFGSAIGYPAVDPSAHDIYVADRTNRRIDVFTPTFTGGLVTAVGFLRGFGWDVSSVSGAAFEVCSGADCKAPGTVGTDPGRFGSSSPTEVGVDSSGNVYALDAANNRVQKFDATPSPVAASFGSVELSLSANFGSGALRDLAVDATTGDIVVAGSRSAESGKVGTVQLSPAGVFVDRGLGLAATASTGVGLAGDALGGNLYVASNTIGNHRVSVLNDTTPTIDPVTAFGATTATFTGTVVSKAFDVTYRFEYSTDGETWLTTPGADVDAGTAPGGIGVSRSVTGLTGSQPYRVRLVATRPLGGGTSVSAEVMFTTSPAAPAVSATKAFPVTSTSATLAALVDPQNEATNYRFEYGSADCSSNPCARVPLEGGEVGSGSGSRLVDAEISGLLPGVQYHFRVVATNDTGTTAGPDTTFRTYPESPPSLADGRAYELVTPPDTRGTPPTGAPFQGTDTWLAAPGGNSVIYAGPALPGFEGVGNNDVYEAMRGGNGWESRLLGPSGAQSELPAPGGASPDHRYAFVTTPGRGGADHGSLAQAFAGVENNYVRGPDGSFELVGRGSLGDDPEAVERWITADAKHMIFATGFGPDPSVQLEPNAPPSPRSAIYDRTPAGLHVISLLPGDVTPSADAEFLGVSEDGSSVVFSVGGTIYERRGNAETLKVTAATTTFAGASCDGSRVFYVAGGQILSFDATTQASTVVAAGGGATVVNVSADGTHVYFISTLQLDGVRGTAGANNLYLWSGGATRFVATVAPSDVTGPVNLARWATDVVAPSPGKKQGPANDPSRTTPDGRVFIFQSHAPLTGYDSEGRSEIFRYDAVDADLECVSCSPIAAPPTSGAELQSDLRTDPNSPVNAQSHIANLTEDGGMVFFQTGDALVPDDVDGSVDVYEWREGGVSLISSGRDGGASNLYGVTPDGHDVFFFTREPLLSVDHNDGVGAIYDARIDGGFPGSEVAAPCLEDACQGSLSPAPVLTVSASAGFQSSGNLKLRRRHRTRYKRNCGVRRHHVRNHRDHARGGCR